MSLEAVSTPKTHPDPRGRRLESWKEIAAYLGRDVTTVRRWERREGLPVYRILHSKLGSVYAYTTELDAWRDGRAGAATDVADADPVLEIARHGLRVRRWLVVCGVVMLALLVVTYFTTRTRLRAATGSKIKSLAVLPLKNLSGDPAQEYFADGMTEEIIGRLSMIRGLRVISRTSAMHFKDTRAPLPEIAKALGVDAIVEGSVIREGGRVRVHAQLIRAATDEHFWSETYDRELGDALGLESDVAQTIAGRVEVTVTGAERARLVAARQVSPEVYELEPLGITGTTIGWILFQARHYDEAIRELRSDLAVRRDDASTYWTCWFLGFALIANGRSDSGTGKRARSQRA